MNPTLKQKIPTTIKVGAVRAAAKVCIFDWDNICARHRLRIDVKGLVLALRERGVGRFIVCCHHMNSKDRSIWAEAGVTEVYTANENCDGLVEKICLRAVSSPATQHIVLGSGDRFAANLVRIFGRFVQFSIVARAAALSCKVQRAAPVELFADAFVQARI
jgi:hypothetical protein